MTGFIRKNAIQYILDCLRDIYWKSLGHYTGFSGTCRSIVVTTLTILRKVLQIASMLVRSCVDILRSWQNADGLAQGQRFVSGLQRKTPVTGHTAFRPYQPATNPPVLQDSLWTVCGNPPDRDQQKRDRPELEFTWLWRWYLYQDHIIWLILVSRWVFSVMNTNFLDLL